MRQPPPNIKNPRKVLCLKGHLRTPENLYSSGNCRLCNLWQVKFRRNNDPNYKAKNSLRNRLYQKSDRWRDKQLQREYGISLIKYKEMKLEQNNCCYLCGIHESQLNRPLNLDHNHKTNKVRRLLCSNCNTAIGFFKDDPRILYIAACYIEAYNV